MTQRVARPMKFAAFISIIISVAVMLAACQGAVGPKGDKGDPGDTGDKGDTGEIPTTAINVPPTLAEGKVLGAQHLALANRPLAEAGVQIVSVIPISTYFEDPEGVASLTYSVADLSADDAKIASVFLTDMMPVVADTTDFQSEADVNHVKAGVTGLAFLSIKGLTAGTVTIDLTVNDGLPGGKATHQIPVMVRATNAQPTLVPTVLTPAAYTAMSRITVNRLASAETVTVTIPDGAFFDADNDDLVITASIGGNTPEAIAANKLLLDVSIDASGNLVLTSKKGGPADGTIPVILTATDPFGTTIETPDTDGIEVKINTPPMHQTYAANADTPTGKKAGDPVELSDIADKDISVSAEMAGVLDFIVLATYFVDPDAEDLLAGANGICSFATDQPTGDAAYATVAFNDQRTNIGVMPLKPGMFQLTVICEDGKDESVTDQVTVEIRQ